MAHPAIAEVIARVGLANVAAALGVTYQAVRKWEAAGRLPRTEWTGETSYARQMSKLTGGAVRARSLLERHEATLAEPTPPPEPQAEAKQQARVA